VKLCLISELQKLIQLYIDSTIYASKRCCFRTKYHLTLHNRLSRSISRKNYWVLGILMGLTGTTVAFLFMVGEGKRVTKTECRRKGEEEKNRLYCIREEWISDTSVSLYQYEKKLIYRQNNIITESSYGTATDLTLCNIFYISFSRRIYYSKSPPQAGSECWVIPAWNKGYENLKEVKPLSRCRHVDFWNRLEEVWQCLVEPFLWPHGNLFQYV